MKTIVKMKFGSHLYGTDHPESDTDYKGIFLPTKEDCILNRIPKCIDFSTGNSHEKNTKDDVDENYYSLQYFMKLAAQGEMIVIDMLHAPEDMLIKTSLVWDELYKNRAKFYTKNLSGYLGYIRKQASKYGVKGSRLAAMKEVITFLETNAVGQDRLNNWWGKLPENEFCRYVNTDLKSGEYYEICGKKFGPTINVGYALGIIQLMYDKYGDRAKQAEKNEGIDWKAVSHAFRASEQLKEIYLTGDLIFPLQNAELIKDIKMGKMHYLNDDIGGLLERNLAEVEALAEASDLPEKFDVKWAEKFILNRY